MTLLVLRWTLLSVAAIGPVLLVFVYAYGDGPSGPIWGEAFASLVFCLVLAAILVMPIASWPLIARVVPWVESSRQRFAISWFVWLAALDGAFLFSKRDVLQVSAAIPLALFFILTVAPRLLDPRLAVGRFSPTPLSSAY
jgi:hypothetical protein